MKSVHYAIASIVDANTGHGLHHDAGIDHYAAAERSGRRIRAQTMINLLQLLGRKLGGIVTALRDYSERRRKVREVVALSDRQLDDIGLSRSDALALELGLIDLAQLEARRFHNLGDKRVRLYRGETRRDRVSRHAVNEAIFARAKCA